MSYNTLKVIAYYFPNDVQFRENEYGESTRQMSLTRRQKIDYIFSRFNRHTNGRTVTYCYSASQEDE